MATKIEWTGDTWNPIGGCRKVSPGCQNCYAIRQARRLAGNPHPDIQDRYQGLTQSTNGAPNWTGNTFIDHDILIRPLERRRNPQTYFISLSDLFFDERSDAEIDMVMAVMALARLHTFQVLTKYAQRMRKYFARPYLAGDVTVHANDLRDRLGCSFGGREISFPLPNLWLGVSTEDQVRADERIPLLLRTPAAVRFLSCEPLLGPVDLHFHLRRGLRVDCEPLVTLPPGTSRTEEWHGIDWVIVGGESGPGARPCDVACIRSIVRQCKAAGVACFVKQLGARAIDNDQAWAHCGACGWVGLNSELPRDSGPNPHLCGADRCPECGASNCISCCYESEEAAGDGGEGGRGSTRVQLSDPKGGNMAEWPEDLRVREMPAAMEVSREV